MQVAAILKQADIFYDLSQTQLELVAAICAERHCRPGEQLFAEGSPSQDLYVIAKGQVEIELGPLPAGPAPAREREAPHTIARLRAGQAFGEIALVDQGVRSAGARALGHDTTVLVIPRDKLMRLCDSYTELGYRLMRNLAAELALKIRNTDAELRARLFFGAGDAGSQ
jgi:CRP-like cAMP-binding protein